MDHHLYRGMLIAHCVIYMYAKENPSVITHNHSWDSLSPLQQTLNTHAHSQTRTHRCKSTFKHIRWQRNRLLTPNILRIPICHLHPHILTSGNNLPVQYPFFYISRVCCKGESESQECIYLLNCIVSMLYLRSKFKFAIWDTEKMQQIAICFKTYWFIIQ